MPNEIKDSVKIIVSRTFIATRGADVIVDGSVDIDAVTMNIIWLTADNVTGRIVRSAIYRELKHVK
jgi:predicted nuclease of predicted toxin-antitoxin system